jgi:hypothetical protein
MIDVRRLRQGCPISYQAYSYILAMPRLYALCANLAIFSSSTCNNNFDSVTKRLGSWICILRGMVAITEEH